MLIARSHSDVSHVNATAPCNVRHAHALAQARPPMSCIPLVMPYGLMGISQAIALFPGRVGTGLVKP